MISLTNNEFQLKAMKNRKLNNKRVFLWSRDRVEIGSTLTACCYVNRKQNEPNESDDEFDSEALYRRSK